jgi:PKD repeat protein
MGLGGMSSDDALAPIAVVQDEQGNLYRTIWNDAVSNFDGYHKFDALRGSEGPVAACQSVALADFDCDGDTDLVTAYTVSKTSAAIVLYLNDGSNSLIKTALIAIHDNSGSFQSYSENFTRDIAAGDVNNDGNPDFVLCTESPNIGVYLGDGHGGFRSSSTRAVRANGSFYTWSVDLGDFDGDGILDCVTGEASFNTVYVLHGNGDGTFASAVSVGQPGGHPFGFPNVVAGDFDNDGKLDILANGGTVGVVDCFRGQGDLTFAARENVPSLELATPFNLDAYDFDGDGNLDIGSATKLAKQVGWFPGNGDGTFGTNILIGSTSANCLGISTPPLPPPASPVAAITAIPKSVPVAVPIVLDGSGSSDSGGGTVSHTWRFGDGVVLGPVPGLPGSVQHAYTNEGYVYPAIRISSNVGNAAWAASCVRVTNAYPTIETNALAFTEASAVTNGSAITLDGNSLARDDFGLASFAWDLDDGSQYRFEDGNANGWIAATGQWSVSTVDPVEGSYSLRQDEANGAALILCDKTYDTDYIAEAYLAFATGTTGTIGIVVGYNEATNHYRVVFRKQASTEVLIERFSDSGRVVLGSVPLPFTLQPSLPFHIRVCCENGLIHVHVDGHYLLSCPVTTAPVGRIGLFTESTTAVFDTVDVVAIASTAAVTHAFDWSAPDAYNVCLTVTDVAGQTTTRCIPVVMRPGTAPVADAGTDAVVDEDMAVDGLWFLSFSAAGSTDDYGISRYEWDWSYSPDDGFQPSGYEGVTAIHTFSLGEIGTNTIAVRVTDYVNQSSIDSAEVVIVTNSLPPVADAGPDLTVEWGYPVYFDAGRSTDDVAVARYTWDFGDGITGTGRNPPHIYRQFTNFTVRLTVSDNAQQVSAVDTCMVTVVTSTPPRADAGGPYTAGAGAPPAYFDGSRSTDNDGPGVVQGIAKYLWDRDITTDSDGDGIPDNDIDHVGASPICPYTNAGVYTVKLTVEDGAGQQDSDIAVVNVASNRAPHVLCVVPHGDPCAFHPVLSQQDTMLRGVARDAGALRYQWDFGDGSPRYPATPATVSDPYAITATHVYAGSVGRPFVAKLIVWDSLNVASTGRYKVVISPDSPETRSSIAIARGLWWLHTTQNHVSGRWTHEKGFYYASAAASALLPLQMNGYRIVGDPRNDPYVETVRKGFDYLFATLVPVDIAPRDGQNPDSNFNQIGLGVQSDRAGYETGMAMDAIAASQSLLAQAATGDASVKHRFFFDVLTDMVDVHAWGQRISDKWRGGWRYDWSPTRSSDNTVSQWAAIGMLGAQNVFGVPIPEYVKEENRLWLNRTYDGTYFGYTAAGSYYSSQYEWYNTTPSAMVQMAFTGTRTTDPVWRRTEDIVTASKPMATATAKNYYAMFAFTKAMRLAQPRPVVLTQGTGVDWFNDPIIGIRQRLLSGQDADGSWFANYAEDDTHVLPLNRDLSTAWAITMLTPSLFVPAPVARITSPARWRYGVPLRFRAHESFHTNPDAAIAGYEWDFDGDGRFDLRTEIADDPLASFTYDDPLPKTPGTPPRIVSVRLRVYDAKHPGQAHETSVDIEIGEGPLLPVADAGGPYLGIVGEPVVLDASGSRDSGPEELITHYEWDFYPDETPGIVTNASTMTRAYTEPGVYIAGVRVSDDGAANGSVPSTSDWHYACIAILERNNAPSFFSGPDIVIPSGALQHVFRQWATHILPGGREETCTRQQVTFAASTDTPDLFLFAPQVSPDGDLTFVPSYRATGATTVTVELCDTGGVLNGGSDVSEKETFTITITGNGDSDDDGIPDVWELRYLSSLHVMDERSDYDGDGLGDIQEYLAGTDPRAASSKLVIESIDWLPEDIVRVEWQSVPTRYYAVDISTGLPGGSALFRPVWTNMPGGVGRTGVDDPVGPADRMRFYRIRVE